MAADVQGAVPTPLPVAAIAEQLRVSVSAVKTDCRAATAFLRSRLVEESGDDPAAVPTPL